MTNGFGGVKASRFKAEEFDMLVSVKRGFFTSVALVFIAGLSACSNGSSSSVVSNNGSSSSSSSSSSGVSSSSSSSGNPSGPSSSSSSSSSSSTSSSSSSSSTSASSNSSASSSASSSSSGAVVQGKFKANNVQGLGYESGAQSGVTGADGGFDYTQGESVTFVVGGVTLGSGEGKPIMTPLDLAATDVEIINTTRFLMVLDEDAAPVNGINIGAALTTPSEMWSPVDFSSASFDTDISSILDDIGTAYGTTVTLPSAADAKIYMNYTYACLASGAYVGTYSGDSSGTSVVWIDSIRINEDLLGTPDPTMGVVYAAFFETGSAIGVGSGTEQGLTFDALNALQVSANGADEPLGFAGAITNFTDQAGTWSDTTANTSGSYTASRLAGAADAVFRISGFFDLGSETLLPLAFDIKPDSTAVGQLADTDGATTDLTGTLTGDAITLAGGGYNFSITLDRDGSGDSGMPEATGTVSLGAAMGNMFGTSCVVNYDPTLVGDGFLPPANTK